MNLWKLADTKMMPESFEYANNGGRKYLFRNLGGGRFEEVSARVGLISRRWALAAVAADLRGTGYPDLFIANDYGVSELFINEGGRFREVGREAGVGYAPKSGMNASVGDVLNQGQACHLRVEHLRGRHPAPGQQPLGADGRTRRAVPNYENLARAMGVDLGGWSFGAQFGDLNNDGFLDLYLVNGYVSASRDDSYWYDYSKVAGGHQRRHLGRGELAGDGHAQPRRLSAEAGLDQRRRGPLRRRRADGRRHRSLRRPLGRARRSRGRGALDVVVANQRGPLLLYRNEVARGSPVDRLRSRGRLPERIGPAQPCTNRSAIGAQVHRVLERPAAGAGSVGRIGLLRAEPAAAALRPRPASAVENASSSAGRRARRRS